MSVSIIKLWLIVNLAVSVCAPNKILSQQYHSHHNVKCNQVWVWSVDHQWNLSSKTWSKYLWNFPHFISSPTFISDDRIQSWNASHFSIQMECQSSGDITSSYWFFTMIFNRLLKSFSKIFDFISKIIQKYSSSACVTRIIISVEYLCQIGTNNVCWLL